MAVFPSRPFNPNAPSNRVNSVLRRYPLLFGLPFIGLIVGASFAMTPFTQTRYDLQKQKTQQISKEEDQRLEKIRRPVDKREEYFRLSAESLSDKSDDWEPKRIARPAGTDEWGVPPPAPAPRPKFER
ncbi:Cytochrome oxidase assembly [Tulasnella sp. JGI-2019a]|nr:Cytochrome oxidase assembly [Tulasnella sp. JGI-2019a]KAG9016238.1 Cytochrome oxidase assembly [Tulasnella sp. JGI-2019a]KAG9036448.1 Cytochrome oxidase assembly [Tulasnella sp. JGI-2019a]